jgi:desulfoferrodoxin-like iron-binding protein
LKYFIYPFDAIPVIIIQYNSDIVSLIKKISRRSSMVQVDLAGGKCLCPLCGTKVEVIKAGGGELVCCGQVMQPVE